MADLISKRKKRRIALRLGFLWAYIKRIENAQYFAEATEVLAELCIDLGIAWRLIENGAKVLQELLNFEERREENAAD